MDQHHNVECRPTMFPENEVPGEINHQRRLCEVNNSHQGEQISGIQEGERPSMSKLLQCSLPSMLGNARKRPLHEAAPPRSKYARLAGPGCSGSRTESSCKDHSPCSTYTTSGSSNSCDCNRVLLKTNSEPMAISSALSPVEHIHNLPHSLLLQILKKLPIADLLHSASLTCKYWYELVYDPELWRDISMKGQTKVEDDVLERLTKYSDNVQSLDISYLTMITSRGVAQTLAHLPHLQVLDMRRCFDLQGPALQAIGECCHQLCKLNLDGLNSLSDDNLISIAAGCSQLNTLGVSQCNKISDTGVTAIAKGCSKLKSLTVDHCTKVTDKSLKALVDYCCHLEVLCCMSCNLTDRGVELLTKARGLRVLEVCNIKAVTNKSIMKVVCSCPKLECINISLCTINDTCIDYIAHNAKAIKSLYLVSCDLTNQSLRSLGSHCKTLEVLDVGWCHAIDDEGVLDISNMCSNLRYLGLMRCDQVSVPLTEELVEKFPRIKYSTMWLDCKRMLERAKRESSCPCRYLDTMAGPSQSDLVNH